MTSFPVAIGCDHAAVSVKQELAQFLTTLGCHVTDVGTNSSDVRVDYPDIAEEVCNCVLTGKSKFGFLLCGTGIGVSLAANKIDGIRAALCHDHYTAKMARAHNDANVMCAGARVTGPEVIKEMAGVFLTTTHEGGRHADRVAKVMLLQRKAAE